MKLSKTFLAVFLAGICCFAQSSNSSAAEKNSPSVKKKILVAYYSRSGTTKKFSEDIALKLGADIDEIIDKKDRSGAGGYFIGGKDAMMGNLTEIETKKNPADYDLVIIGTPIWSWDMSPAVRTYITNNKAALKSIALFTTAGSTKPNKTVAHMETLAGKTAIASTGILEKEVKNVDRAKYDEILAAFLAAIK